MSVMLWSSAYAIKLTGRVTDEVNNEGIPFATVQIFDSEIGVITNVDGDFTFPEVEPGEYRLKVSYIGYKTVITEAVFVRFGTRVLNVSLQKQSKELDEFTITANPFLGKDEAPLAYRRISPAEIEFNPGANRDISKVVQSFPGVAGSTAFRNDLIVRGGGPAENSFYLEGIEIPNLNHFATQGASGGPVGIINADLIREVDFLSGSFPVNRGDAMSSVLDFKMIDGSEDQHFKLTLGASEVSAGAEGMIGDKTNYVLSLRRSYLQFLFQALELPFLPTFNDFTLKVENKIDDKNELTFLAIGAYDDNVLNLDAPDTEENAYTLSTIPYQTQWNYTVGLRYRHYFEESYLTVVLSNNHLYNYLYKYLENENEDPSKKILDYKSNEDELKTRIEHVMRRGNFKFLSGAGMQRVAYDNSTFQKVYVDDAAQELNYNSELSFLKYSLFEQVTYFSTDNKLTASVGLRLDANTYSEMMKNPLKQLAPRANASYKLWPSFKVNASLGRFYQLPAYTTLGYRDDADALVNERNGIKPIASLQYGLGVEWLPTENTLLSVEGFYKDYRDYPMSVSDSVSLASKGGGYDLYGDEEVFSNSQGRAYGAELMARYNSPNGMNFILAYTWVNSEFTDWRTGDYLPSAWDNKHLFSFTGTKRLPKNFILGLKFRAQGGSPYTPYDEDKSSLVEAWDATGTAYLDYSNYNSERLKAFTQLDLRVDKNFFFDNWMLGLYLDVQNALGRQYEGAPVFIQATDANGDPVIYTDTNGLERYEMKYISSSSGTILPSIGIMIEF